MQDRHGNTDSSLRGLLAKLFGGWSMGAGQAPTINQPGVSALSPATVNEGRTRMADTMMAAQNAPGAAFPPVPTDSQALQQAQAIENGPMNDANLPPGIRQMRAPQRAPQRDYGALQQLIDQQSVTDGGMSVTEGPNARIDNDTRSRALAWALRNNQ